MINPTLLWNAQKACLRGLLIQLGVHEKKKPTATTNNLLDRIHTLELANKAQPSLLLDDKPHLARCTLSEHLHSNFDLSLKRLCLHFYTQNNKPGACHARQLKHRLTHSKIQYLTSPSGTDLNNPKNRANLFSSFYANLYNLSTLGNVPAPSPEDITRLLYHVELPSISPEQLQTLSAPFSQLET